MHKWLGLSCNEENDSRISSHETVGSKRTLLAGSRPRGVVSRVVAVHDGVPQSRVHIAVVLERLSTCRIGWRDERREEAG